MINVYIGSKKLTPIGLLNGTRSSDSAAKLSGAMISDLMNDIDPSVFLRSHNWAYTQ